MGTELDTPALSYLAFMVDRLHRVPYAQTFDPSAPGSLLFHLAIGRTVGYGETAFGVVNLAWLTALSVVTWRLMRQLGPQIASAASALVALGYLQHGRDMSLQRDYVAILPITLACLLAAHPERGRTLWRATGVGLLFGLVATIKPQLAIGLPIVVVFLLAGHRSVATSDRAERIRPARNHFVTALGAFACPVAAALGWIAYVGGWRAFVSYYTEYLPLYLHLDAQHHALVGNERLAYLAYGVLSLGGLWLWVLPAALGAYAGIVRDGLAGPGRRLAWLLRDGDGLCSRASAIRTVF
ncbi:MAG: hypothetical protein QOI95_14 [Acidimicrobiaceae bacterium]